MNNYQTQEIISKLDCKLDEANINMEMDQLDKFDAKFQSNKLKSKSNLEKIKSNRDNYDAIISKNPSSALAIEQKPINGNALKRISTNEILLQNLKSTKLKPIEGSDFTQEKLNQPASYSVPPAYMMRNPSNIFGSGRKRNKSKKQLEEFANKS